MISTFLDSPPLRSLFIEKSMNAHMLYVWFCNSNYINFDLKLETMIRFSVVDYVIMVSHLLTGRPYYY